MTEENKDLMLYDEVMELQTTEQVAKARNKRRDNEEAKLRQKLKEHENDKKKFARLKEKIEKSEEEFKVARKKNRNHAMIFIGTTLVAMLGYSDKDKVCVSKKDFENLTDAMIADVKKMMGEEYKNYHFGYSDLVFALGFMKEEKMCSVPEDYNNLNAKILEKVKELIRENAKA